MKGYFEKKIKCNLSYARFQKESSEIITAHTQVYFGDLGLDQAYGALCSLS